MTSYKTLLIVSVLLVGAVIVVGGLWLGGNDVDNSPSPSPSPTPTVSATATPQTITVRLTEQGISPKTVTIRTGDAVTFLNETTTAWWPASDPHPVHTLCPGFDANRALQQGESYTLTFTTVKTCTYHDHRDFANTAHQGTIIVQ